jgi:hypothetical protein
MKHLPAVLARPTLLSAVLVVSQCPDASGVAITTWVLVFKREVNVVAPHSIKLVRVLRIVLLPVKTEGSVFVASVNVQADFMVLTVPKRKIVLA